MRLVMPHGGYGLGNELIPWAKGYILAAQLNARLLHPAWGRNPRGYARYFGTSRFDWQWYRLVVRALPKVPFTEQDYRASGENNFSNACTLFIDKHHLLERRHYIVTITGLWGAFAGIRAARHFVLAQVLNTKFTQENLRRIAGQLGPDKLTVGIHVRLGDFRPPPSDQGYRDSINTMLPMAWYSRVCKTLVAAFGTDRMQFLVASDGSRAELKVLLDELPAIFISELPQSDCSDLIALSETDLLVCSLSTYSSWAAFLSRSPYVCFAPNLSRVGTGVANKLIVGLGNYDHGRKPAADSPVRGIAIGMSEPLPAWLLDHLEQRLAMKNPASDLVQGGTVQLAESPQQMSF